MQPTPNRILRLPQVQELVGLRKTTIYQRIKDKDFPPPVKLGARASGWMQQDIDAWISQRGEHPPVE
jgi:prophage regulatory protein